MVMSDQVTPGMTLEVSGELHRVERCIKVASDKGLTFIKMKLRNLQSGEVFEKSFPLSQSLHEVLLEEKALEFLYLEDGYYLFLEMRHLDTIAVPEQIVGEKVHYLKPGTEVSGFFYGDRVSTVELPPFLELMVASIDDEGEKSLAASSRCATLETGAQLEVPPFIEVGDIIKIDTSSNEYIQRV